MLQSIAAEHTRGVIVTEIHQTLHALPHEACFLVKFRAVCRYSPDVYRSDLTSAIDGLGQQHEALQNDVIEHDLTLWSDD